MRISEIIPGNFVVKQDWIANCDTNNTIFSKNQSTEYGRPLLFNNPKNKLPSPQILRVLKQHRLYQHKEQTKFNHLENLFKKHVEKERTEAETGFEKENIKMNRYQKRLSKIESKPELVHVPKPNIVKWVSPQNLPVYYSIKTKRTQQSNISNEKSLSHILINDNMRYFGEFLRSKYDYDREADLMNQRNGNRDSQKFKYWYSQYEKMIKNSQNCSKKLAIVAQGPKISQNHSRNPLIYNEFYTKYIRQNKEEFTKRFLYALMGYKQEFSFEVYLKFYQIFICQKSSQQEKRKFVYDFFSWNCLDYIRIDSIKNTIKLLCENIKYIKGVTIDRQNIQSKLMKVILGKEEETATDQELSLEDFIKTLQINPDSVYIFIILMFQKNPRDFA